MKTSHKVTRRRAQGRPNEGKNSVGPELLIRAARELLETLPPAKVTRAAVARHAGVDPNLIRYYFKDRDSLLLSVVEQIIEERAAEQTELQGSPAERLREQIRRFLEFNAAFPFFHRLLIEEIATWKSARARQLFHRLNQYSIATYTGIVKDGSKDKTLRNLDPVFLHIALIGMCEFFLSSKVLLEDAFGKGTAPADYAKRYADTLVQLVVDGARQR